MKELKIWVDEILEVNPKFTPSEIASATHNRLKVSDIEKYIGELNDKFKTVKRNNRSSKQNIDLDSE